MEQDREREFVVIESKKKNKKKKKGLILAVLLIVITVCVYMVLTQFNIQKISVSGNEHYTKEEIIQLTRKQIVSKNSLAFYLKSKISPVEKVPFIEKIDVEYVGQHSISLTVYEKAMAGCISYMNQYMYFDKDGIVLESSSKRLEDIPCVKGLEFNSVVVNEKLPTKDKSKFSDILTLTQEIKKNKLLIQTVKFDDNDEVILYYGEIKINLGKITGCEEKIAELPNILEKAKGMKGTLHMEKFDIKDGTAVFEKQK